ncbi:MAG: glycerophosphodiester phosphodiesterase [Kordiimonadaceae bacterium]|nr:glycerophosphodiester phosphodiesterase [Kordiimonadaceae bacterium]MBT6031069.1 glycerophosphodiester phosphodiesterase [Kordiimonadaceae bacterium]
MVDVSMAQSMAQSNEKLIIAHRGASGYLPEHTLPAKAMAYEMGADYIEQDVVMTKDDKLVVLHDHYLDRVTDVQEKFANRKREDGRYYAIDFTLAEIKSMKVSERYRFNDAGEKIAVFPGRYPLNGSDFSVPTLEEEIELIQGLNKSTGRDVGIYTEVKSAAFHLSEGKDLSKAVLMVFKKYGYLTKQDKAYYQTFEIEDLIRVHNELLPELNIDIKLIQLMGGDEYYKEMITQAGIKKLATYADGIGPSLGMITASDDGGETYQLTDLVKNAHAAGMDVHPYTFRKEKFATPKFVDSFEELLDLFLNKIGVDGVFTDFPDLAVQFRDAK